MASIRGTCDSCGKTYGLPREGAFRCKACGGTVRVAEAGTAHAEGTPDPRARRERPRDEARRASADASEPRADRAAASAARRRASARKAKLGWGLFAVLVAGAIGAFQFFRHGVAFAGGLPRDPGDAQQQLVEAWKAGDAAALAALFHPDLEKAMRTRLVILAEQRGWTEGFPALAKAIFLPDDAARLKRDDADSEGEGAETATALLVYDDDAEVCLKWQFEPLRNRWYAFDLEVPPPDLDPLVERFAELWQDSSAAALRPLFPDDSGDKLVALVERKAEALGWGATFPDLGAPVTTGDRELRGAIGRAFGQKVETVFPVDGGELKLRWRFRPDSAWHVVAMGFPKDLPDAGR